MQIRLLFRLAALSLGIALLLAALFFETGVAVTSSLQETGTPTPDRLAEPTLPASPSQADHGAQVYWLSCLPCHGDRGQGLTDEFRQTYPPEDQYCWNSGCHGDRPYANGFKLPRTVPALVGPGALQKFSDASVLHGYIAAAMPFWKPGSLSEQDSWSVTAFLLRQNGLWEAGTDLGPSNAQSVRVSAGEPAASPTVVAARTSPSPPRMWLLALAGLVLLGALVFLRRLRRDRSP
ncbi:MAG: c-type cytochrome [Bacteroidota bacterium]